MRKHRGIRFRVLTKHSGARRYVDDCQEKVTGSLVARESHSSNISSKEPLDLPDIYAKATFAPDCSHTLEHIWAARARQFLLVEGLLCLSSLAWHRLSYYCTTV